MLYQAIRNGVKAFSMGFYVNLAKSWATFNVCYCHRYQINPVSLFLPPLLSLSSPKDSSLNTVWVLQLFQHTYYTGALLMWWSVWGRKAFYNHMIKSQSSSGSVSLACQLHKCFWVLFFPSLSETGRLDGLEFLDALSVGGIGSGEVFLPGDWAFASGNVLGLWLYLKRATTLPFFPEPQRDLSWLFTGKTW